MALHKPREPWLIGKEVSWQTADAERFLAEIEVQSWYNNKNGTSTAAFMELSDAGVDKYDERIRKLFREKRHDGFRFFYLTQRAATVHPDIRENCTCLYLFTCGGAGAKLWADEFVDDEILKAAKLPAHYFVHKPDRYTPAVVRILQLPKASK